MFQLSLLFLFQLHLQCKTPTGLSSQWPDVSIVLLLLLLQLQLLLHTATQAQGEPLVIASHRYWSCCLWACPTVPSNHSQHLQSQNISTPSPLRPLSHFHFPFPTTFTLSLSLPLILTHTFAPSLVNLLIPITLYTYTSATRTRISHRLSSQSQSSFIIVILPVNQKTKPTPAARLRIGRDTLPGTLRSVHPRLLPPIPTVASIPTKELINFKSTIFGPVASAVKQSHSPFLCLHPANVNPSKRTRPGTQKESTFRQLLRIRSSYQSLTSLLDFSSSTTSSTQQTSPFPVALVPEYHLIRHSFHNCIDCSCLDYILFDLLSTRNRFLDPGPFHIELEL